MTIIDAPNILFRLTFNEERDSMK